MNINDLIMNCVKKNPKMMNEMLMDLAENKDKEIRLAVAESPYCPVELLMPPPEYDDEDDCEKHTYLLDDSCDEVREAVIRNSHLPSETIDYIVRKNELFFTNRSCKK